METKNSPHKGSQQSVAGGPELGKCFFGQKGALKIQYNREANSIFIGVGRKNEDNKWNWKNAKIKDTEGATIINVLTSKISETSFYHTFDQKETKIWIRRKDDFVYFRIEDYSKPIDSAEQFVSRIILEEAIRRMAQKQEQ